MNFSKTLIASFLALVIFFGFAAILIYLYRDELRKKASEEVKNVAVNIKLF